MIFGLSTVDFFLNVLEASISVCIFTHYGNPRHSKRVSLLMILSTIFMLTTKTTLENTGKLSDVTDLIFSLSIYITFCWLYFESTLAVAVFAAVCVGPLNMLANVIALCIGEMFTGMSIAAMITQTKFFTNLIICAKILFLVIGLGTAPYIRNLLSYELGKSRWNIVVLMVTMYNVVMCCFQAFFSSVLTAENLFIIFMLMLIVILLILRIFWEINDLNKSRSDLEIDLQQFLRKKERYQTMETMKQESTSLKQDFSDIRDHLMRTEVEKESLSKLLESTQARLDENKPAFRTGNRLYDMMLNSRADLFKEMKITITTEIYSTEISGSLELDLYTAFCNLLDNAIENCQGEDKRIKIKILSSHGMYHLIVKNSISESVLKHNEKLITKKEEKQKHGFGIFNVKDIAKKHHGGLQFEESQGYFSAHLMMEEV